jgi:hypothetical protein
MTTKSLEGVLIKKAHRSELYQPHELIEFAKCADPEKLTLMQAVKIINFRMKNKNSDDLNKKEMIKESENIDISKKE